MSKSKTRRTGGSLLAGWWERLSGAGRRTALKLCAHLVLVAALAAGAYFGLRAAERYARGLERYQGPVTVVLNVKPRANSVLRVTQNIVDANIPKDAVVVFKKTDRKRNGFIVEHLGQQHTVSRDDVTLEWLTRFPHVRESLLASASAAANKRPTRDARSPDWFDASMAPAVREAALRNPYVERVEVSKQLIALGGGRFDRQVAITAVLRKPLAQIWHSVGNVPYCYLLDEKGHVLARGGTGIAELPQVTGFAAPLIDADKKPVRDPAPGATLGSADLLAGLALLAKIENQPYFVDVAEAQVANYAHRAARTRAELELVTRPKESLPPQAIGWGARLDLPENVTDLNTADEKVEILRNVWTQYRRLNLMDRVPAGRYNVWRQSRQPWFEEGPQNAVSPPAPPHGAGGARTGRRVAGH